MRWVGYHLVKEALAELADASFQERVWLGSGDAEIGSIVEAMSQLFDDSGLGDVLDDDGELAFTAEIDDAIVALEAQLKPLALDAVAPAEILRDERILGVRELAQKALFAIVRHEASESRAAGT